MKIKDKFKKIYDVLKTKNPINNLLIFSKGLFASCLLALSITLLKIPELKFSSFELYILACIWFFLLMFIIYTIQKLDGYFQILSVFIFAFVIMKWIYLTKVFIYVLGINLIIEALGEYLFNENKKGGKEKCQI